MDMDDAEPGTPTPEGSPPEAIGDATRRRIVPIRLAPETEHEPAREYVNPWSSEGQQPSDQWGRPDESQDADAAVPVLAPAGVPASVDSADVLETLAPGAEPVSAEPDELDVPLALPDEESNAPALAVEEDLDPPLDLHGEEEGTADAWPEPEAGVLATSAIAVEPDWESSELPIGADGEADDWWSATPPPSSEAPAETTPQASDDTGLPLATTAAATIAAAGVVRPTPDDPYSIDSFWQQYDRSAGRAAPSASAYRPPSDAPWPPVVSLPQDTNTWMAAGSAGAGALPPWGPPAETAELPAERAKGRPWARELVETLLLALIIFLAVRSSVQNFRVDGSSMFPSLEDGEYLIVNKLIYARIDMDKLNDVLPFIDEGDDPMQYVFRSPRRGDVIVFEDPSGTGRDFIKRVVGEPGDRIQLRDGGVYVNGLRLEEDYTQGRTQCPQTNRNCDVIVPDDHYFVLGDNREHSSDSRTFGAVDADLIVGRAMLTYWPLDKFGLAPNETFEIAESEEAEPVEAEPTQAEATTEPE
jgi:signal peptidase I